MLSVRYRAVVISAVLLAALTALFSGHAESAGVPVGAVYTGSMSDGGVVTIKVDASGSAADMTFQYGGTVPPGCSNALQNSKQPINSGSGFFASTEPGLDIGGFWDSPASKTVVGWVSKDAEGACPAHRVTWAATSSAIAAQTPRLRPGIVFTGLTVSGTGTLNADVTMSADGASAAARITYSGFGGCQSSVITNPTPLVDGVWFAVRDSGQTKGVVAVVTASGFSGAFSVPASGGCPAAAGPFSVAAPTSSATPTATPAARPPAAAGSPKLTGSIPPSGGFGLVVFGGGTSSELVTASGCPSATAAFWVDDGSGGFIGFVPGTTIAVVNAAWNARFSTGIPANTPLVGRCQ